MLYCPRIQCSELAIFCSGYSYFFMFPIPSNNNLSFIPVTFQFPVLD